jgi:hypothetical protein
MTDRKALEKQFHEQQDKLLDLHIRYTKIILALQDMAQLFVASTIDIEEKDSLLEKTGLGKDDYIVLLRLVMGKADFQVNEEDLEYYQYLVGVLANCPAIIEALQKDKT